MRAVLTRVRSASVTIDGEVVGKIGRGFLILLGVGPDDTEKECRYLAEKALGLRIFTDEEDKMNLGLDAVGGEVLVVSQFTLYGNDCDCFGRVKPAAKAAAPALPRLQAPSWAKSCTKSSWISAKNWAIRPSTAVLAPVCR